VAQFQETGLSRAIESPSDQGDKRTDDRIPLNVAARYSESDPAVLTGGCPNCPD
jgi:hypothetical protein